MLIFGKRLGLPCFYNVAGLVQHVRNAVLDGWRNKVAKDLCGGAGFRGGSPVDIYVSRKLLESSHVREREKSAATKHSSKGSLE